MIRPFLYSLAAIAILSSCNRRLRNFDAKDYYFPYFTFQPGMAYKFVNDKDSNDVYLWGMHVESDGLYNYLFTDIYTGKGVQVENMRERLSDFGSETDDFLYWYVDSTGSTHPAAGTVTSGGTFNWTFDMDEPCKCTILYTDDHDNVERNRTRTFVDTATLHVMNERMNCMKFTDTYQEIRTGMDDGAEKKKEYSIESYYAEGKGLVRYIITGPDKKVKAYTLVKTKAVDTQNDL